MSMSEWYTTTRAFSTDYNKVYSGAGSVTGTAPLINDAFNHYLAKVTVGTNQTFLMLLDTGSSDTWVRGQDCKAFPNTEDDGSCNGKALRLSDKNIAPILNGGKKINVTVKYGSDPKNPTSALIIDVYHAKLTLGDTNSTSKVSAVTKIGVSVAEKGFPFDGIMGLGYDSLSEISSTLSSLGDKTPNANFIDSLPGIHVFGFYISSETDGDVGEFSVGGIDSNRVSGDLTYFKVGSQNYWDFGFEGAKWKFAGLGAGVEASTGGSFNGVLKNVIVDSGTPFMVLDDSVASAINSGLGATFDKSFGLYKLDCNPKVKYPTLQITLGNGTFDIPSDYYIQSFKDGSSSVCYSLISPGGNAATAGILGIPFMRSYYSVFDKVNNQIGFGLARHGAINSTMMSDTSSGESQSSSNPKVPLVVIIFVIAVLVILILVGVYLVNRYRSRSKLIDEEITNAIKEGNVYDNERDDLSPAGEFITVTVACADLNGGVGGEGQGVVKNENHGNKLGSIDNLVKARVSR
ncbi:hypothetical protein HDU76_005017 [Blyttiomyces sp. JEL0837]|nr:hypothetical protein HDU76_005017 [Blyttiomyces sp. JEL0837]